MHQIDCRCRLGYSSGFIVDCAFTSDARVTALFGPSGSGKTSVLSVIAGLRRPGAGRIAVGPRTLLDTAQGIDLPPEARRIGYVFQEHLLFPHMDVRQNLLYGRRRRPASAHAIDFDRVVQVLELGTLLGRAPSMLSGGEKQRVALGRALLSAPDLLLLDEPLAALDQPLKERVLEYVEQILEEWRLPAIYVTHQPAEITRLAEHVVIMEKGRVTFSGDASAVNR